MLSGQPCGVWGDGMDCQHDIMSLLASTWDASLLCRCSLLSVPRTSSMGPKRQQSMLEQPASAHYMAPLFTSALLSLNCHACRDVLHRMEDAALAMRHAAEVQETKINEMGRERDVLLKLRHKAEGASSAQVP